MTDASHWQDRSVLVTGGAGFIGSNLAHALAGLGARVTALDDLNATGGGDACNLHGSGARLVRGDVCDMGLVEGLVADADAVLHCAARTSHPDSMENPHAALRANVVGTLTILEACRRAPTPPTLVHAGTTSQTGPTDRPVLDKDTPEQPIDVYSATKSAAEKLVHVYRQTHGLPCCSVRISNVYGPRARNDTPRLGFLNFFIGQALRGQEITVYGEGNQVRNATYVDDVTDALLRAAARPGAVPTGLTLAAPEALSVRDLARIIVDIVGGSVAYVPWPTDRARMEVGDVRIDPAPARDALGWEPRILFADGVARTATYGRAQGAAA